MLVHMSAFIPEHIHEHTYTHTYPYKEREKKGVLEYAVQTVREMAVNGLVFDGLMDSHQATLGKPCGKLSCGLISIRCFS